jgi:hypothetical protein
MPDYVAKGAGSWKAAATGIVDRFGDGMTRVAWSEAFEASDYRKYHVAVKEHLADVVDRILPAHGIRLS